MGLAPWSVRTTDGNGQDWSQYRGYRRREHVVFPWMRRNPQFVNGHPAQWTIEDATESPRMEHILVQGM